MLDMQELYWAAGFLEGEGSFLCTTAITVTCPQVQREPLDRLSHLFGGKVKLYAPRPDRPREQPIHKWSVGGAAAAGLMMTLWTLMSPRRRVQIEAALSKWRAVGLKHSVRISATGKCFRGHPMTPENTMVLKSGRDISTTYRRCRTCHRTYQGEYQRNVDMRARRSEHADRTGEAQLVLDTWTPNQVDIQRRHRTKEPRKVCAKGHALTEDNIYHVRNDGERRCRICMYDRHKKWASENRDKMRSAVRRYQARKRAERQQKDES